MLQQCDRTSPPSTLQTPTPWWGPLPLGRGFPSAGLLVQWPQGTQARGPWWAQVQPCSRSQLAGPPASRELWEEPWPRSSRASQVGQQSSWVSIKPECSHYYLFFFSVYLFQCSECFWFPCACTQQQTTLTGHFIYCITATAHSSKDLASQSQRTSKTSSSKAPKWEI